MLVRRCNRSANDARTADRRPLARHLVVAAFLLVAFPANASAVILMVVLGPLTLFEVKGLTFESYATSEHASLRVENTDTGQIGPVDLIGQIDLRPDLVICGLSRAIPDEKVLIEIDVRPLQEAIVPPFVELSALGVPDQREITDPALRELASPLVFGFSFESETVDPLTGDRRTTYQLESVRQVPEPSGFALLAIGGLALFWRRTSSISKRRSDHGALDCQ
jgi:hypothetical protein